MAGNTTTSSSRDVGHEAFQQDATDPSFRSDTGIAIKGASTADLTKSTMPKHFTQPLTCFYWHKNGVCTKKDEDCLYAHYYTGVVAAAPVTVRGGNGTVAGRNAIHEILSHAEREKVLKNWEAFLIAKQMELNGRAAQVERIDKAVSRTKAGAANALRILESHREDIEAVQSRFDAVGESTSLSALLSGLDDAINAVLGVQVSLEKL